LTTETSLWTCACYRDCHEAGVCCYLLHPMQLFYFNLWLFTDPPSYFHKCVPENIRSLSISNTECWNTDAKSFIVLDVNGREKLWNNLNVYFCLNCRTQGYVKISEKVSKHKATRNLCATIDVWKRQICSFMLYSP
jgi:hypothetical protein